MPETNKAYLNLSTEKAGASFRKFWNLRLHLIMVAIFGLIILSIFTHHGWQKIGLSYAPEDVVYFNKIHIVHDGAPPVYQLVSNSATTLMAQPEMKISDRFYDFGVVMNSDGGVKHTFVITNTGQAPLEIQRAYTTCACITADITSSSIPPGKVALMDIEFTPPFQRIQGSTIKRGLILETNDPGHPVQEVWIQATIK